MNVMELLVKAANSNHGRTLDPSGVKAVVEGFQALDHQLRLTEARLDAVIRTTSVLLEKLGGHVIVQPEEFDEADERPFVLDWKEEENVIHVRYEVPVSEMQLEVPESYQAEGHEPSVSEDGQAEEPVATSEAEGSE